MFSCTLLICVICTFVDRCDICDIFNCICYIFFIVDVCDRYIADLCDLYSLLTWSVSRVHHASCHFTRNPVGRNMEDTMTARDRLESVRAARRNAPGESSSLTGSLTANYSHHQREWAMQIRALQNRQVRSPLHKAVVHGSVRLRHLDFESFE